MNTDILFTIQRFSPGARIRSLSCDPTATTKGYIRVHLYLSVAIFHRRLRRYQPQINTHERRYAGNRTELSDRLHEKDSFVSICIYPWFNLPPTPKYISPLV